MKNKVVVIGLSGESIFLNVNDFHKKGETLHANCLNSEVGGKGYNQILALKKFGCDCFYLSGVGNDASGKKCEDFLIERNIKNLMLKKDLPTALATILINSRGDNQVTVYEGATNLLNEKDVILIGEEIKSSDVLSLQLEVPLCVNLKAAKLAKENNVKIIINPAPAINYSLELLQYADIITPNESEARKIFALSDNEPIENISSKLDEYKIKEVIVTLGEKGAIYISKDKIKQYLPLKVCAIDTTGAGDTFNAMLAFKLANGFDIDLSIKYAIIASALSVTKSGVINAIPTTEEIEKYVK